MQLLQFCVFDGSSRVVIEAQNEEDALICARNGLGTYLRL